MSVNEKAHPLSGGSGELDETAMRMYGKDYTRLTDDEASNVWDDIEAREENQEKENGNG